MNDLKAELVAVLAEREAKAAMREKAKEQQRLAIALERAKRDLANDDVFAKLEDESEFAIGRVTTPAGDMVVVKAPVGIVYQRLIDDMMRTDHQDTKRRTSAAAVAEKAARECVVYPDRVAYNALVEKFASLPATVVTKALELGKSEAEDEAKK